MRTAQQKNTLFRFMPFLSKPVGFYLVLIAVACLAYLGMAETFSNKNKQSIIDTEGQIIGLDLLDHHDTFDYEPVELETQFHGAEI
jgi:hypothetical protein